MTNKTRIKWITLTCIVIASVLFGTNPTQATHLKAIQETRRLRNPSADLENLALRFTEHHNYYLFSTTTFGDIAFSRGYLGRVEVTDNIKILDGIPIQ